MYLLGVEVPRVDHSWFFPRHFNFIHLSSNTIYQIYKHKDPFHFSCTWMYKDLSFQETNIYMYFRVFQHKLLNIKFCHNRNSVSERWRKIHKTGIHKYCPHDIIEDNETKISPKWDEKYNTFSIRKTEKRHLVKLFYVYEWW